jgi:hypothetical protein
MNWIIGCLFLITGIVVYFPTVIIRKMNRQLRILEQIESNTRGAASAQRSSG